MIKAIIFLFLSCLVISYCYGNGNVAEIRQKGGGENIAVIEQKGDNNTAIVEQGGSFRGSFADLFRFFSKDDFLVHRFQRQMGQESQTRLFVKGNNNYVFQLQRGNNDFAALLVNGHGNIMRQAQIGNDNQSIAEIFGNFNALFHFQQGNGFLYSIISIVGDGKKISVIQE